MNNLEYEKAADSQESAAFFWLLVNCYWLMVIRYQLLVTTYQ